MLERYVRLDEVCRYCPHENAERAIGSESADLDL
jgi:hypothetical protein